MRLGFHCGLLFLFRRTVNNVIGDEADGQRRQQVQNGMLPEKNCGDGDEKCCHTEDDFPGKGGEMPTVPCGKHYGHGAHHMERGTDVGVGVKAVEKLYHMHHPVVPGEFHRPEFLTVGKQNVDRYRRPIGDGEIADELSKGGDVIQQRINVHADEKQKPEKVGNHKPLAEGNMAVKRAGHNVIAVPNPYSFENIKDNAEAGPEQKELQMGIPRLVQGAKVQIPIVHDACMFHRRFLAVAKIVFVPKV